MQELREMWSVGAVGGRTARGGEPISRSGTVKWGCLELTFSGNASRLISRLKTFPNLPIPHSITLHPPLFNFNSNFRLSTGKTFRPPLYPENEKSPRPKIDLKTNFINFPKQEGEDQSRPSPPMSNALRSSSLLLQLLDDVLHAVVSKPNKFRPLGSSHVETQ